MRIFPVANIQTLSNRLLEQGNDPCSRQMFLNENKNQGNLLILKTNENKKLEPLKNNIEDQNQANCRLKNLMKVKLNRIARLKRKSIFCSSLIV